MKRLTKPEKEYLLYILKTGFTICEDQPEKEYDKEEKMLDSIINKISNMNTFKEYLMKLPVKSNRAEDGSIGIVLAYRLIPTSFPEVDKKEFPEAIAWLKKKKLYIPYGNGDLTILYRLEDDDKSERDSIGNLI